MHKLEINLSFLVHIGISQKEKLSAQELQVCISLFFNSAPPACTSDMLKDTICYKTISDEISYFVKNRNFNTVEHFTQKLFDLVSSNNKIVSKIKVSVFKKPFDLPGHVSFSIEN